MGQPWTSRLTWEATILYFRPEVRHGSVRSVDHALTEVWATRSRGQFATDVVLACLLAGARIRSPNHPNVMSSNPQLRVFCFNTTDVYLDAIQILLPQTGQTIIFITFFKQAARARGGFLSRAEYRLGPIRSSSDSVQKFSWIEMKRMKFFAKYSIFFQRINFIWKEVGEELSASEDLVSSWWGRNARRDNFRPIFEFQDVDFRAVVVV